MPDQSDFPDKWVCDGPEKSVKIEVRLPSADAPSTGGEAAFGGTGFSWVEIPTQSVELWVEKGEAARVQRTAKVEFPTEWGPNDETVTHNSPRQLIDGFDPTDSSPFMFARIFFENSAGEWVLEHFGWVGGVGQSGDPNLSKLWVYDVAELLSGVPIGITFNNPTIRQALEEMVSVTNERSPIPLSGANLVAPETEEELATIVESTQAGGFDQPSGVGASTEAGQPYYSLNQTFDQRIVNTGGATIFGIDSKSFVANHDTLQDVYDWFERRVGAKLHFEPQRESVRLVADVEPSRRRFVHDAVVRQNFDDGEETELHEVVSVLSNDALYEMKPVNTLHLRGETARGWFEDTVGETISDIVTGSLSFTAPSPSFVYPVVTVQVPSLVEAANGVTLSHEVITSDATTLDGAEREAIQELTKTLEETTEGEIILRGEPYVMPFDELVAFEVCNDEIEYEQSAVSYEVESVKHVKTATDVYKTRIKVSVWANDDTIETVTKEFVESGGNE